MKKEIFVQNKEGEKLAGLMEYKKEGKLPAVILFHGLGVTKKEFGMFDDIVNTLIEEGFVTFRFDFSGNGDSEGKLVEMTLTKRISEVKIIVDFVLKQESVIQNKVGVIGMSFGTSSVISTNPPVNCIALLSPPENPAKSLANIYAKGGTLNKEGISNYKGRQVNPQFWKNLENYDILELIKKIKIPIMLLQGDADQQGIRVDEAKNLYNNANEPKEVHILTGANHGFFGEKPRKEMLGYVKEWFNRWIK